MEPNKQRNSGFETINGRNYYILLVCGEKRGVISRGSAMQGD